MLQPTVQTYNSVYVEHRHSEVWIVSKEIVLCFLNSVLLLASFSPENFEFQPNEGSFSVAECGSSPEKLISMHCVEKAILFS